MLGKRGFEAVHLVEAEPEIGGRLRWMRRLPTLGDWGASLDWRAVQLDRLSQVEVITGRRLTAADVLEYGADVVVIATGSHWREDGVQPDRDPIVGRGPARRADAGAGGRRATAARRHGRGLRLRGLLRRRRPRRAPGRRGLRRPPRHPLPGGLPGLGPHPGGRALAPAPAPARGRHPPWHQPQRVRHRVGLGRGRPRRELAPTRRGPRPGHPAGVGRPALPRAVGRPGGPACCRSHRTAPGRGLGGPHDDLRGRVRRTPARPRARRRDPSVPLPFLRERVSLHRPT